MAISDWSMGKLKVSTIRKIIGSSVPIWYNYITENSEIGSDENRGVFGRLPLFERTA